MRSISLLGCLVLAGCGGNWSNTDLVFLNALPRATDLQSQIPTSSGSPLTGVGTREDGLNVGDPSKAYADSRKAAADYNTTLVSLLGLVDQVRLVAPSARTANSRTWGPYADPNNDGREVILSISNDASDETHFHWTIGSRAASQTAFLTVLDGDFVARDSAQRGQGTISVPVKDFRDVVKVDDAFKQIDQIDIQYATAEDPRDVRLHFDMTPGNSTGFDTLDVISQQHDDGSGAIQFLLTAPGPEITRLRVDSGWLSSGAGKAISTILEGTVAGYDITECWGTGFTVSYYAESWPLGASSGSAGDCVNPQLVQ